MGYCLLVVISNSRAKNSAPKDQNGLLASGSIEKRAQEKTVDHSALQTNKYKNNKFFWFLDVCGITSLLIVVLSENCLLYDRSVYLLVGLLT